MRIQLDASLEEFRFTFADREVSFRFGRSRNLPGGLRPAP